MVLINAWAGLFTDQPFISKFHQQGKALDLPLPQEKGIKIEIKHTFKVLKNYQVLKIVEFLSKSDFGSEYLAKKEN